MENKVDKEEILNNFKSTEHGFYTGFDVREAMDEYAASQNSELKKENEELKREVERLTNRCKVLSKLWQKYFPNDKNYTGGI